MAHYTAQISVPADPQTVFAFLSRFDRAEEWDPGVREGRMLTPEPIGLGSRFRLLCRFLGRDVPLEYEIVELDAPRRVVFHAETAAITTTDRLTFTAENGGTRLDYDARLELKGLGRVAAPLVALAFRRIGDNAAGGLRTRLALLTSA